MSIYMYIYWLYDYILVYKCASPSRELRTWSGWRLSLRISPSVCLSHDIHSDRWCRTADLLWSPTCTDWNLPISHIRVDTFISVPGCILRNWVTIQPSVLMAHGVLLVILHTFIFVYSIVYMCILHDLLFVFNSYFFYVLWNILISNLPFIYIYIYIFV